MSACVNAADTLGRYLRKAYEINDLKERGASLKAVRDKLTEASSLHTVLKESPGLEWMEHLRNLRGESQHGKLAGTLYLSPGTSAEPLVPRLYCESDGEVPISAYIEWTMAKTAELITKSVRVIAVDPEHAVQLKNQTDIHRPCS